MGRRCGERHPRQPAVARRCEEAQRIPSLPPRVAESRCPIEDGEVDIVPGKMMPHGQTRLPGTDDDRLEPFHAHGLYPSAETNTVETRELISRSEDVAA